MIILDTNVISELMKPVPDERVLRWFDTLGGAEILTTVITLGELRYGLEALPDGRRRDQLRQSFEAMIAEDFADRILPYDTQAAQCYGVLAAKLRHQGRPIGMADVMIASIAQCLEAPVATRNISDFLPCGIDVINPFDA